MADISTEINNFKNATLGEEVRSSMISLANKINTESTNAATSAKSSEKSATSAQDSAANSATAASESASAAETAKSAAAKSATAASESASTALSAQEAAEAAKSAAAKSAAAAVSSATAASESASAAATSQKAIDDSITQLNENIDECLQTRSDLIRYHAIFDALLDSDDTALLDSSGNEINGKVVYADAGDVAALKQTVTKHETIASKEIKNLQLDVDGLLEDSEESLQVKSDLVHYHAIFDPLLDSDGDVILDSKSGEINGKVVYADAGDVAALKQTVDSLTKQVNRIMSMYLSGSIRQLIEHALLDNAF